MKLTEEKKYTWYERAVQGPEDDVAFMQSTYKKLRGKPPKVLREDFGGTGLIACTWAKKSIAHRSYALDIDTEPLSYGLRTHRSRLKPEVQKRVRYIQKDVLKASAIRADIISALNFSYLIFKERQMLKAYFSSALKALNPRGIFCLDILGGPETQEVMVESRGIHGGVTYHWDCTAFNPINHHIKFSIHFQPRLGRMIRDVFMYDWRLWTLPEIKDLLLEAGFSDVIIYWEGDDGRGSGDGVFKPTKEAENCLAWVSYIVALK